MSDDSRPKLGFTRIVRPDGSRQEWSASRRPEPEPDPTYKGDSWADVVKLLAGESRKR